MRSRRSRRLWLGTIAVTPDINASAVRRTACDENQRFWKPSRQGFSFFSPSLKSIGSKSPEAHVGSAQASILISSEKAMPSLTRRMSPGWSGGGPTCLTGSRAPSEEQNRHGKERIRLPILCLKLMAWVATGKREALRKSASRWRNASSR